MIDSVNIIGTGNVAFHLGSALSTAGVEIKSVFGRNEIKAKELSEKLQSVYTSQIEDLPSSDLTIIAVSDDAIASIAQRLGDGIRAVHTSGAISMNEILCKERGVFYPLQTFSSLAPVSFDNIPILVEAKSSELSKDLVDLGKRISNNVQVLDSHQRKHVHLAAVVACNFSNHLYSLSKEYLESHDLSFDLLKPLIEKTAQKIIDLDPEEAQTGPAKRKDIDTVNSHLEMLSNNPELHDIYAFLTDSILKRNKK